MGALEAVVIRECNAVRSLNKRERNGVACNEM